MSILFSALLTVCMLAGVYERYAPFASVIGRQQRKWLLIWYTGIALVNFALLAAAIQIWDLPAAVAYLRYGGIVFASVMLLVNILVLKRFIMEQLFVYGVVLNCNYLLMTIPNYLITFIRLNSNSEYMLLVTGSYCVLLLLTLLPVRWLLQNTMAPTLHMEQNQYWNTVWVIPIAFFLSKFLSLGGDHNSGGLRQILGGLLYVSVIVLLCLSIAKSQRRIARHKIIEEQLENQKLHYTELQVRVNDARKARHDLKHQVASIRHFVDTDDKEGLRQFCNDLLNETRLEGEIPYTGNAAADGVVYYYMRQCQKNGIDFRYSGVIQSRGIADTDLSVLLGNGLDNACTGCMTLSGTRSIRLMSQTEQNLLTVVISNTFDGVVSLCEDRIMSRKEAGRQGVGLLSMNETCEKYGGHMDTSWDDKTFTVTILLPLTSE